MVTLKCSYSYISNPLYRNYNILKQYCILGKNYFRAGAWLENEIEFYNKPTRSKYKLLFYLLIITVKLSIYIVKRLKGFLDEKLSIQFWC